MRRQTRERRRNGRRERRCDDKRNVDNEKTHAKENQTIFIARLSSHRLSCAYPHIVYPASGVISSQPRVGRLIVNLASIVSTSLTRVSSHRLSRPFASSLAPVVTSYLSHLSCHRPSRICRVIVSLAFVVSSTLSHSSSHRRRLPRACRRIVTLASIVTLVLRRNEGTAALVKHCSGCQVVG